MQYIITRQNGEYSIFTEECWHSRSEAHKKCNVSKKTFNDLIQFGSSTAGQFLLKTIWQESC